MNLRQPDLKAQAREIVGELSELLNHSVTNGIRLRSYIDRQGGAGIGYETNVKNPLGDSVPLTISKAPARLYLSVLQTLELDDSGTFLTTSKISYTLEANSGKPPILTASTRGRARRRRRDGHRPQAVEAADLSEGSGHGSRAEPAHAG